MGKHCDLCSICDPANPNDALAGYAGKSIASLTLEVFPNGDRHRLPPGDYVVKLKAGAANADPVAVDVELNLKGGSSPDPATMFRDFVGVRIAN